MAKLSICRYVDDGGKIHSIYINWYWDPNNATENIAEVLCSVSWINCYCCALVKVSWSWCAAAKLNCHYHDGRKMDIVKT